MIMEHAHQDSRNLRNRNQRLPKHDLDQFEQDNIMRVLVESIGLRSTVHLQLYHEFEDCAVIGVIDKIDPYTRKFLVDGEWFRIADIIKADRVSC
jgi:hypothetical protein